MPLSPLKKEIKQKIREKKLKLGRKGENQEEKAKASKFFHFTFVDSVDLAMHLCMVISASTSINFILGGEGREASEHFLGGSRASLLTRITRIDSRNNSPYIRCENQFLSLSYTVNGAVSVKFDSCKLRGK